MDVSESAAMDVIEAPAPLLETASSFAIRALLLAERLDTRGLERDDTIATMPLTLRVGRAGGVAFLFRYGVAVFAGLSALEEDDVVRSLRPRLSGPLDPPETDLVQILVKPDREDQVDPSGAVILRQGSPERLQIVANVLSKSIVLSHYEARIADAFDQIEPLADRLQRTGGTGSQARQLLQHIGRVLLTQHRMVGRVEVEEKPDVLWDHPELERLYARLEDEYELAERSRAMERKLALISKTVDTLLDLVQNQRSVRLEWYIIGLIALELLLSIGSLVLHGGPG
ncbi:MAG TPA: RMD1 family protein [Alphaproteobacteria bacterium]|nr:RMD1 family protein [Alphaproteobacteria bacterium]